MNDEYIKAIKSTYFFIVAFSLFSVSLIFDPSSDIDKARNESSLINKIVEELRIKREDHFKYQTLYTVGKEEFAPLEEDFCSSTSIALSFEGLDITKRDVTGKILQHDNAIYLSRLYVKDMFEFRDIFADKFVTSKIQQVRQASFNHYREESKNTLSVIETIDLVNDLRKLRQIEFLPMANYDKAMLRLIPVDSITGTVLENRLNVTKLVNVKHLNSTTECSVRQANLLELKDHVAQKVSGKVFNLFGYVKHNIRRAADSALPYFYVSDSKESYIIESITVRNIKGTKARYLNLLTKYCDTHAENCDELMLSGSVNNFDTLRDYQSKLKSESLADLDKVLNIPLLDAKKEVSLFGFVINANMFKSLGPSIVLLMMVYLILHLRKFDTFIPCNSNVPWVATYPGFWTVVINIICLVIIPLTSAYYSFSVSTTPVPWFTTTMMFTLFAGIYNVVILNKIKNTLLRGASQRDL
ncbi:hypothetical protein SAMN04488136_1221 [Vibrio xiamenensis]|uniref:Uncharacterized protein n=1 Tax=Vibrio xiamenensis TaxID=861298 RepID=A0A1G8DWE8_9VIBR|nr:hypothetical protein [Vibrio xiamenensis]SDH62022.1 hypothetical protein SAMN04488136_1221 [Vibrio xiamenensis]